MSKICLFFCFYLALNANCFNPEPRESLSARPTNPASQGTAEQIAPDYPAAHHPELYQEKLRGKSLALVVNQTSTVHGTHLVDTLLAMGQNVRRIFAPEHGFRGEADAGAKIEDGKDPKTGIPIRSLYGKNKKPTGDDLTDIDLIIFDIQDVGARFYTYISTLHYVMESAARYGKPVLILDRPNPNGNYVDGPIRKDGFESFVGLDPIPVVHGLTVGEYARMVNGEGWLGEGLQCELDVIGCADYTHASVYELPVAPSPNLPNQRSIYLYPSLCFFEGTALSIGRGTNKQFQIYGHPQLPFGDFYFTPQPGPGAANPKLNGEECRGYDLSSPDSYRDPAQIHARGKLDLEPLISTYRALTDAGETFFTRPEFFDLLAGSQVLRESIEAGMTEEEIRESWQEELQAYQLMREQYLLYP